MQRLNSKGCYISFLFPLCSFLLIFFLLTKNDENKKNNDMTKRKITYAATKGLFLLSALTSLKFGCAHCNSSSKLDSCSLARTFSFQFSVFSFPN